MRNFEGTKQFQNKDSHDHKQQLGEYREPLARENPVSHGDGARIRTASQPQAPRRAHCRHLVFRAQHAHTPLI